MKVQLQSNSAVDKIAKSTEQFQTTLLEALGDKSELPRSLTAKNFSVGYNQGGEVQITVKFKPKKTVGKAKAKKLKDDAASIKLARKPGTHSKALFKELNAGKAFPRKVFGYWRPSISARGKMPFPVAMDVRGYDKADFLRQLTIKQREARLTHDKGTAHNRWTGGNAGSGEYSLLGWRWPQGARTYLRAGVPPSKEFYKFITGRSLAGLPY